MFPRETGSDSERRTDNDPPAQSPEMSQKHSLQLSRRYASFTNKIRHVQSKKPDDSRVTGLEVVKRHRESRRGITQHTEGQSKVLCVILERCSRLEGL
ncbi:hypothetical protein DPX16_14353 [Anabarilius grahami]|uniref:Uncharacterized protein n=1 Tax=Anabarilius grahami TaxID=495550 RepID=A0A3N0XNP9_ANAGA|nr:hypothetical protein DPX16_14353 [Anabarilius grahami]